MLVIYYCFLYQSKRISIALYLPTFLTGFTVWAILMAYYQYFCTWFSSLVRVQLTTLIPWDEFEKKYAGQFFDDGSGTPAKSIRIALGSSIIKEK